MKQTIVIGSRGSKLALTQSRFVQSELKRIHPLLDWTNNYGIRFFLPWSQHWSYGDFVFIVDPYLWLILGGAAFLLTAKTRFLKVTWGVVAAVTTFLVVASPRSSGLPYPRLIAVVWIAIVVTLLVLAVLARVHTEARSRVGRTPVAGANVPNVRSDCGVCADAIDRD